MARFYLHISDGKESEVEIDARNPHQAINDGMNALAMFACKNFPPPENVSIVVSDADRTEIATLSFAFTIKVAAGVIG